MSYCSDVAITMFEDDYLRMVELAKATGDEDIIAIVTTIPEVHDLLESNGKKCCSSRIQLYQVVF